MDRTTAHHDSFSAPFLCVGILPVSTKSGELRWSEVLNDHDLAQAIVDRVLEKGRLIVVDSPSYPTRHIALDKGLEPRKDVPNLLENSGHNYWLFSRICGLIAVPGEPRAYDTRLFLSL